MNINYFGEVDALTTLAFVVFAAGFESI